MKRYRLSELPDVHEGHFLQGIVPGAFIYQGALGFKPPGFRTHVGEGEDGSDRHVHEDHEIFVIVQGKGVLEVNGESHPFTTGDVLVVEAGEDHHLVADRDDPCINLWLHAGNHRHPDQESVAGQ